VEKRRLYGDREGCVYLSTIKQLINRSAIKRLINRSECPECKHDLIERYMSVSTDLGNIFGKEREMIAKGKYRMFECFKCSHWFIHTNGRIYRYDGSPIGWLLIANGIVKERVIFT